MLVCVCCCCCPLSITQTTGALAPEEIVLSALNVLKGKLAEVSSCLKQEEEELAAQAVVQGTAMMM